MFEKKLTLTATTCGFLEDLRLALEVLKGAPVRFKHVELDKSLTSGHGALYIGEKEYPVTFSKYNRRRDDIDFDLCTIHYKACFWKGMPPELPRGVRVGDQYDFMNGFELTYWVGTSINDRRSVYQTPKIYGEDLISD